MCENMWLLFRNPRWRGERTEHHVLLQQHLPEEFQRAAVAFGELNGEAPPEPEPVSKPKPEAAAASSERRAAWDHGSMDLPGAKN